jgi:hypothetical protein
MKTGNRHARRMAAKLERAGNVHLICESCAVRSQGTFAEWSPAQFVGRDVKRAFPTDPRPGLPHRSELMWCHIDAADDAGTLHGWLTSPPLNPFGAGLQLGDRVTVRPADVVDVADCNCDQRWLEELRAAAPHS